MNTRGAEALGSEEYAKALGDAAAWVAGQKAAGRTVALCNGAFDLLHVGHLRYLTGAKALADVVVVAINADASVRRAKGAARPIVSERERLELVTALRPVDYAFLFDTATVDPILEALRPTMHCKGTDYTPESVPEAATAARLGIRVCITGDAKNHATTDLVSKLGREKA